MRTMKASCLLALLLFLHQHSSSSAQDCPAHQDLLSSLRRVEQTLRTHESSYQQSLRSLRRKLSTALLLQTNSSCPKPEPPPHGRRLGRVFAVGHEVHFLCKPGYELIGPRTRVCLHTLSWSGQQPMCRLLYSSSSFHPSPPPFRLPSPSSSSSSSSTRPSHCTHFLGSTRCMCDVGFTISGHDSIVCSDIDECQLFPAGVSGRLCVHECTNTPGSFHCLCPAGYNLDGDTRGCRDIDECEGGTHNCSAQQVCVNTYGGFQCVTVECPYTNNATYIKTSAMRCDRNPCMLGDRACSQAPNSISFHFLAMVSNMSAPRVLFRVSAARVLGETLRFGLAGGSGRGHFSVQRSGRQTGTLLLVAPVLGPATLEAEVEMSELERSTLLGRYVTKITLFVSPYTF